MNSRDSVVAWPLSDRKAEPGGDGERWEQPEDAMRIYQAFLLDVDQESVNVEGPEINLLEARDRLHAAAPPRLYQVGRFWYSPGEAADAEVGLLADPDPGSELESFTGDEIRFYFSQIFPEVDMTLEVEDLAYPALYDLRTTFRDEDGAWTSDPIDLFISFDIAELEGRGATLAASVTNGDDAAAIAFDELTLTNEI